jgi:hypothetical protein
VLTKASVLILAGEAGSTQPRISEKLIILGPHGLMPGRKEKNPFQVVL